MGNEQTAINHNLIIAKAKELAEMISQSSEVEIYKKAEEQIKANEKVQQLIEQIRRKQKEAVALEAVGRSDSIKKVEQEMDELHDQLDEIPLVAQFKQTQLEINDLLQMVTNVIANTVSEKIIVSTGGDPLSGETGYPVAGGVTNVGACGRGRA